MSTRHRQLLPLALATALMGCEEMQADVGDSDQALATENGLSTVNGLSVKNGLSTVNGLSVKNGLSTVTGLATGSGLMTTDAGRMQVTYLVRCALPATVSITKQDQYGKSYTFQGLLGMAPAWQDGVCDTNCQENVSACMLAHVNTAGIHVPLWIVSQNAAVGWGQDPEFPNQEGAFFGNIFLDGAHGTDPTKAPMYYCAGAKYNINPPQGRIGSNQTSPPYINPLGAKYALCASTCNPADYPSAADGFKACAGWNSVVTVWRQNTTTTTTTTTGGIGHGFRWK
jgi:hypothetical protein